MSKTLLGLAFINYNWETYRRDIIDSYVPICGKIAYDRNYEKLTRDQLKADLSADFGIEIPLGPVDSILRRMQRDGFLNRREGEYFVQHAKVKEIANRAKNFALSDTFDAVIEDIRAYTTQHGQTSFTTIEIQNGIIDFFREQNSEILFASDEVKIDEGILPSGKSSKKIKYLIARFILELQAEDKAKFGHILKLAQGYFVASMITYTDFQSFTGNLKSVEIFLDAPIVFNLLGLNGSSGQELAKELIESLLKNGAQLKIFDVNYSEVVNSMTDAIDRLTTKEYDLFKSSRLLRTAVRERYTAQNLRLKLTQFDSTLENLRIGRAINPSLNSNEYKFQIDEEHLQRVIEGLYKNKDDDSIPEYKIASIERDVQSISNIFKIRKNTHGLSLKACKAIFLTNNDGIAYGAKIFEWEHWPYRSQIPVCLTDIFLSTILWANYGSANDGLKIKQLMSECYNVVELDNKLLHRFYKDVKRLHNENRISNEDFYLLSATNIAVTLLEQKTFNDIEEYTDSTPAEILEDIRLRSERELKAAQESLTTIGKNVTRVAKFCGRLSFFIIAFLVAALIVILKTNNPSWSGKWYDKGGYALATVLGLFGVLRWMERIPTKTAIETAVEGRVYLILTGFFNKKD